MNLKQILFIIFNCFIFCNLYGQHGLFLPSHIEEFEWTLDDWTKISQQDIIYYNDGKSKHYDKYTFNSDGSESKEIVDFDTLTRITNLLILHKEPGSARYISDRQGKNCYVDFFNSCGYSSETWDRNLNTWVTQNGRRSQPILSNGTITGLIWENWNNNRQQWIKSEKEEFITDANQILIEKIIYFWNTEVESWNKQTRLHSIKLIPERPTLYSSYTKQLWNGTDWIDFERVSLIINGKIAYKEIIEKFENNSWIPFSRNQFHVAGGFDYERYINNKWIVVETRTEYENSDHHQRYAVSASGDTTSKHFHKRWYDSAKNTLRYQDYTNTLGSILYYEEINDVIYDSKGYLDYYILNSKTSENGIFERKKKFDYSNYVNVTTGLNQNKYITEYSYSNIFPNPSTDGIFNLENNLSYATKYTVHNLQGIVIKDASDVNKMINLNELPNGSYILSIGKTKNMISIMK